MFDPFTLALIATAVGIGVATSGSSSRRSRSSSTGTSATPTIVPSIAGRTIISNRLGDGATATVEVGTYNGKEVAIKTCTNPDFARHEAKLLSKFAHANIVTLFGHEDNKLFLEKHRINFFDLEPHELATALRLMKDTARGIDHLHRHDFVHGDVTPPNLLADATLQRGVVIDLFTTVHEGEPRRGLTPTWQAPEAELGKPTTKSEDIYGLGLTYAYLLRSVTLPTESRLNRLLTAMVNPQPQRPTSEECLRSITEIIDSGAKCPRCGYWTPQDVPWCPTTN